jgi:ankyrin repeat protein
MKTTSDVSNSVFLVIYIIVLKYFDRIELQNNRNIFGLIKGILFHCPNNIIMDPSLRIRNAIIEDNYFIVARLLKKFPSLLDNIDPSNGWSNLHYSAYHNNYQISQLLLKSIHARFISSINQVADRNFSQHFKNPDSLLYTQITDEDEIKLTFEKQTVLHVACLGDSSATLNLLLDYFNVCLDQRDINGLTPSHICCIKGYHNCLAILLEKDAYPNLQDNDGDTLLHKSFQFSQLKCLELLIKYNADDQLYNNIGWKPMDVAFNNDIIQEYKSLKSKSAVSLRINTDFANKMPQSKYGPVKINSNNLSNVTFLSSGHNTPTPEYQTKVNLPPIQPRKYSLSSMLSEDYNEKLDNYYDVRSVNNLSKTSRNSSPTCSTSNKNLLSLRKLPPPIQNQDINLNSSGNINKRYTQPPPIAPSQSMPTVTSPRRSTISNNSLYPLESPTSKRSSLSTRTFRSNSQLSDLSPVKNGHSQLLTEGSASSSNVKSGPSTPRHGSLQSAYKANNLYPFSLQVEEASSKLQDLKSKNNDRLKLDTKLGNIINNTSQENLVTSPTTLQFNGAGSVTGDMNEFKNNNFDTSKRSKVLSIPILSSRAKHNT